MLLLAIATCQLTLSGKVSHFKNDQSADSTLQGRSLASNDGASRLHTDHQVEQAKRNAGKEDELPIITNFNEENVFEEDNANQGNPDKKNTANKKRFLGIIDKVKQHVKKKYWTKQRFMETLKALGILDSKEVKLFQAPKKLIRKLMKSENHVIDTYNKSQQGQCPHDVAKEQDPDMDDTNNDLDYQGKNDAEMNDHNDEVKVIENDDGKLDKMVKKMMEVNGNNDIAGNDQEDDLEKMLKRSSDGEKTTNDDQQVRQDVQKRSNIVDLCHETFSTLYVLAFPDANLAYKIPSVHCPDTFCNSKALGFNIGKCVKKEKELLLYVINSSFQFIPKTVTCGCACECLHFSYLA